MSQMISRRRLLQAIGAGAMTHGFHGSVSARISAPGSSKPKHEKSCIFVLLCGGPSHLDMWDMKPDAPAEIRGPFKPAQTTVPGLRINELHTNLAKLAQHFCLIRSMTHVGNISNHFDAMHHLLSGQANAPLDSPYLGSILAKQRPSQRAMASYVWLIKCIGDPVFCAPGLATGGYLGAPYAPLFVGDAENNPSLPNFRPPDSLVPSEPADRIAARQQLLEDINPLTGTSEEGWRGVQRRGFEMATSAETLQAFNMEREDPRLRDRYGRNPLGQNLMLARRLVEAGVGFVVVNGWAGKSPTDKLGGPPASSWDMHGSNMGMGNAFGDGSYGMGFCLPRLDQGLAALITDLKDRGMLDSTLIVAMGEFGRTPKIIPGENPGRQHWPQCYPAFLAGGGVKGGMVYGESDKIGAFVKDKPVRMQDLSATIFHALDVPYEARVTKDGLTRPLSTGTPLDIFE
jgi:hypothetical protein